MVLHLNSLRQREFVPLPLNGHHLVTMSFDREGTKFPPLPGGCCTFAWACGGPWSRGLPFPPLFDSGYVSQGSPHVHLSWDICWFHTLFPFLLCVCQYCITFTSSAIEEELTWTLGVFQSKAAVCEALLIWGYELERRRCVIFISYCISLQVFFQINGHCKWIF